MSRQLVARARAVSWLLLPVGITQVIPAPRLAWRQLSSAELTGPLLGAVALLAWAAAAWLALVALLTVVERLPGSAGHRAGVRWLLAHLAPASVRTLTSVAVGGSLVLAGPGMAAADQGPRPPAVLSLDWPRGTPPTTDGAASLPARVPPLRPAPTRVAGAPTATPAPRPHATAASAVPAEVAGSAQVLAPAVPPAPSSTAPGPQRQPEPPPGPPPSTVVVRPGDSLWSIARRSLGPGAGNAAVATAWPRWWAANRAQVGADPDLIRPGTTLHAPG